MKARHNAGFAAILLFVLIATPAEAQLTYTVTDLGTLGGATSTANSVNNAGHVVGFAQTPDGSGHAFLFKDGKMQDLGTLGGAGSTGNDNNIANMAGAADVQGTNTHAFMHSDQGVTDLGTLGGNQSSALGMNTPGQIVGFSTTNDGSVHAFLHINGQMFNLNSLCDVGAGGFKVLTVAKAINDSLVIVGEGIAADDQKHAFMLTPLAVDGGQWSYVWGLRCCPDAPDGQWVWIQIGGGWWWESHCGCYVWHGPPGNHPPCPPQRPHCWWWPLPCCKTCEPPPRVTPTPPKRTPPPRTATPPTTPTKPPTTRTPKIVTPTPYQPPTRPPFTATPPITVWTPGIIQPTPPKWTPTRPPKRVTPTPPFKTYTPGIVMPTPSKRTPYPAKDSSPTQEFKTYIPGIVGPTPSGKRAPSKGKESSPSPTPYIKE